MQLSGDIDFVSVVPLLRDGDAWLSGAAPALCRLDMGGVTRCNSAGTALLLAWLRTAAGAGKSLRVEHPPESLVALMQLAGLDTLLQADTRAAIR
jgi:ABC-type transporter Mla MlaB component